MIEHKLWTEKYRPETLDEVIGHKQEVNRFKKWLDPQDGGGLPHCILAGPPGTGKTTTAMAFAQELYGPDWRQNVREFNASDDRGIDVVRDEIKPWCRSNPAGDHPYKIVFLDEADQLTTDAQPALRRVMEQYSDQTRFIMTCNYVNEIHDALQSRCATFWFGPLEDEEIREVLRVVIEGEDIDITEEAIDLLIHSSRGRARDAVSNLRMSYMGDQITETDVKTVTGAVDYDKVRAIFETALEGNFEEAMTRFDVDLLKEGANPSALIDTIFRVLKRLDLPEDQRVKCFELLATIDERIHGGLNPHVNFHALLGHVYVAQGLSVYQQQEDA